MISFVLYTDGEGKNTQEWKKILKKQDKDVDNKVLVGKCMEEKIHKEDKTR